MPNECKIERDSKIHLHIQGTLKSVTRWINTHEDGIAEWLKNIRRAYLPDRANVDTSDWVAVLLLKDKTPTSESRIGLLDVGGLTLEDIEKWSYWLDPEASERGSTQKRIEETQGNGGKAYMYNMFTGPTRIFGVRDNIRNCKGFVGENDTEERGTPGFIPNIAKGKNAKSKSFWDEISNVLEYYGLDYHDLPTPVKSALEKREAFTLVEGVKPKRYKEEIFADDLLEKIKKCPQALLPLEQLEIFIFHNGKKLKNGKPLKIDPLEPRPGFDAPRVIEIPESLSDDRNIFQSTTAGGKKPKGKLTIYTSLKDLSRRFKVHRWNVLYKTSTEIVGKMSVGEIIPPGVPASQFLYAEVELDALSPDYVDLGRSRPNSGPLLTALNIFISEKICELAEEIHEKRMKEWDEKALDELHEENKILDKWKNKYFSELAEGMSGLGMTGEEEGPGTGPKKTKRRRTYDLGIIPAKIDLRGDKEKLYLGRGVKIHLSAVLKPIARDAEDNPIPNVEFRWISTNRNIANFSLWSDELECLKKGNTEIYISIEGTNITRSIPIEIWEVDHVLLTPRHIELPVGTRKKIIAEVTNDEAERKTEVILNWKHDAKDKLVVSINPTGWITGNRDGKTIVHAGAGDCWSKIGAEIIITPSDNPREGGEGFPTLLLTDKDVDPETGEIRKGDPDQPPLWQLVSDVKNNIWWLNLQNPQVSFTWAQGESFWRMYHAEKLTEMFIQALMDNEFTKDEYQEPKYWGEHKFVMDDFIKQTIQLMWDNLIKYVEEGREAL